MPEMRNARDNLNREVPNLRSINKLRRSKKKQKDRKNNDKVGLLLKTIKLQGLILEGSSLFVLARIFSVDELL